MYLVSYMYYMYLVQGIYTLEYYVCTMYIVLHVM